jgi:hypothetical protein
VILPEEVFLSWLRSFLEGATVTRIADLLNRLVSDRSGYKPFVLDNYFL